MLTLVHKFTHEKEIKKSRFIAVASRVDSPEEAIEFLKSVSHQEATHNCYAYKIGDQYRFSDDGEPGGTAGRPILAAIEGQGLNNVIVVVIRYYGGTKLGSGGLVRAYGQTASQCLKLADRIKIYSKIILKIQILFDYLGVIYPVFKKFDVNKLDETYIETGLILNVELIETYFEDFKTALNDATRGNAIIQQIKK